MRNRYIDKIGLIDVDKTRFPNEEWRSAKGFEKHIDSGYNYRVSESEVIEVIAKGNGVASDPYKPIKQ